MKRRAPPSADQADQSRFNTADITQQLSQLPTTVAQLSSQNHEERFQAVVVLRKLLSIERNPPIDAVIKAGAIPPLITVLLQDPESNNQFEAAWALTNVASGTSEQTQILLRHKGAEAFINKVADANTSNLVKEQSIWALGNIAGDSHLCRDHLLQLGAMELLLKETGENIPPSLRRNVVWSISNLCRGKPAPPFEFILPAVPVLANLLNSSDPNVITDACWALSYISDGDDERKINSILQAGVCQTAVRLLNHQTSAVQTPALRVIGNIVTGDEIQTQVAISSGCLPALKLMLDTHNKKSIKREVCWTLSNITAGNRAQIQAVLDASIVDSLIFHMKNSEFDVRKEAAWAIANATSSGTSSQIAQLVAKGCIEPLSELVTAPDVRVVAVSLEGLENILRQGEALKDHNQGVNPYAQIIEETGGLNYIEKLGKHPSQPIFSKAQSLFKTYFSSDDIEVDSGATSFEFGSGSTPSGGFSF